MQKKKKMKKKKCSKKMEKEEKKIVLTSKVVNVKFFNLNLLSKYLRVKLEILQNNRRHFYSQNFKEKGCVLCEL